MRNLRLNQGRGEWELENRQIQGQASLSSSPLLSKHDKAHAPQICRTILIGNHIPVIFLACVISCYSLAHSKIKSFFSSNYKTFLFITQKSTESWKIIKKNHKSPHPDFQELDGSANIPKESQTYISGMYCTLCSVIVVLPNNLL